MNIWITNNKITTIHDCLRGISATATATTEVQDVRRVLGRENLDDSLERGRYMPKLVVWML